MFLRRALLQLTASVATSGLLPPVRAAALHSEGAESNDLAQAQTIWARLNGDLSGRPVHFATMGSVWGFKPQADDLSVEAFAKEGYGYAGLSSRKMSRRADGAIVVRQKSWAFYRNLDTGELTDRIPNLWTGVVDIATPLSGPTAELVLSSSGPSAPNADPYRMRIRKLGSRAFVSTSSVARFRSGGIDWFKLEANLASHQCAAKDLADAELTHVPGTYAQNLVAEWQTWTHMHGQPGHILFKGDGVPLLDPQEIPEELQRAIAKFFPAQLDEVKAWR